MNFSIQISASSQKFPAKKTTPLPERVIAYTKKTRRMLTIGRLKACSRNTKDVITILCLAGKATTLLVGKTFVPGQINFEI
jgi:hypothetical protein